MSLPTPSDDVEPTEHYDEADPEIQPSFRSLKRVPLDDGRVNIYDPDDPDRRWAASDSVVYLEESI